MIWNDIDITKMTRAQLNELEPEDHTSEDWQAWNELRIRANDHTAQLVSTHESRLVAIEKMLIKHITESKEDFANIKVDQKRISDNVDKSIERIEKLMTNHLPHIIADIELLKSKLEL